MRVTLGLRGDYAVRAMLALASAEPDDRPMSVRWIAERMAIPVRFLPHVMTDLSRAGLVVGAPGRRGGYRLGRTADLISVLQVVDAVEAEDEIPRCVLRGGPCRPDGRCAVHDLFAGASEAMRLELSRQSLAELAGTDGIGALTRR
ncbi:MAG: Rrf2 family transcriptional regulator [Chloroflexi bacterium]|nr:Rrf2 family transcriptional regulator [Chloroflexota bacterium]